MTDKIDAKNKGGFGYPLLGDEPATLSIDDMKCCGNCHHRESMDNGDEFIECCSMRNNMASWQVCNKWKYDNVNKKHRGVISPN